MSIITDASIFIVDSSRRKGIDDTDADFSFEINIPRNSNYDRVCLLQAIIPKSYYIVEAPRNTMTLSENGVETIITLLEGNYNVISWITLIGAQLTASSSQGYTYTITFPDSLTSLDTGKFTYTVTGNAGVQPKFIFNTTTEVHEQFGFSRGSTNTFVGNSLDSANVVKFQAEDVLLIHSDISYNSDQSAYTDVLQEIYASSTPMYSNVIYQCTAFEAYSKKLLSANKNIYRFTITDEHNNKINLNGLNCVLTLVCYNKDNINQIIASDILKPRRI